MTYKEPQEEYTGAPHYCHFQQQNVNYHIKLKGYQIEFKQHNNKCLVFVEKEYKLVVN